MKSLQAPNLKMIALAKVMYTAILRYDQAFNDMSEESEKKIEHFIVKKPLQPVPSKGII